MKLRFFSTSRNFGDAMNRWFWPTLLSQEFESKHPDVIFFGIGTILQEPIPPNARKVVFGSGAGYETPARIDDTFDIRCVRGPNTARRLGLPPEQAVTDPAYLLSTLDLPPVEQTIEASLILHWQTLFRYDWQSIANDAGLHFIDTLADSHDVIDEIRRSKLVLAESMHGAIIADAFGVPWVPIKTSPSVNHFKWDDWCQTIDVTYEPTSVMGPWKPLRLGRYATRRLLNDRQPLTAAQRKMAKYRWPYKLAATVDRPIHPWVRGRCVSKLRKIAANPPAQCSTPEVRGRLVSELSTRLDSLRQDYFS